MRTPSLARSLGLLFGLALPVSAPAQACLGRPLGGLVERAVVAEAGFASYDFEGAARGADLGVAYWANPGGLLAYEAGYTRRIMQEGGVDPDLLHAGLALELPTPALLPPGAGLCATASARAAWISSGQGTEYSSYSVPLGVSIGLTVPAGQRLRLLPYLRPLLVMTWSEGEVLGLPVEESYTSFALEGGAGVGWGRWVVRITGQFADRPATAGFSPLPDLHAGLDVGIRF